MVGPESEPLDRRPLGRGRNSVSANRPSTCTPPRTARRRAVRGGEARRRRRTAKCRGASLPNVIHWGWRGAPAPSNPRPGGTPPAPPITPAAPVSLSRELRAWLSPWPARGEVPLLGLARAPDPSGQVTRPVVHQDAPALKQVRAGIGRLDLVPDDSARAASITSWGWSVFSYSGIRVTVLFPADAGMNRSNKQAHPMAVECSTISASGGQGDAAVWVSPFQKGGGDIEG